MDLNFFSDALDIADIQADDEKDLLMVAMKDGSVFAVRSLNNEG